MAGENKLITLGNLSTYTGLIKNWTNGQFRIVETNQAETGYLKTYKLQYKTGEVDENEAPIWANVPNSASINIPKDFFLKSATIETCETADEPVTGYKVGDKYFDFAINVSDDSGTTQHVYLAVTDVFQAYTAGDGIEIENNTIGLAGTVAGNGLTLTSGVLDIVAGDGIQISSDTVAAKLGTGLEINSTSKAIDLVAQNATSESDANAPTIGGINKADYVAFKGAIDTVTAPTETAPTADSTKNETVVTKTHTFATADVDGTAGSFDVTEYYVTYGNATASVAETGGGSANGGTDAIAAKAGLMSGTDKDKLDSINFATSSDIEGLF